MCDPSEKEIRLAAELGIEAAEADAQIDASGDALDKIRKRIKDKEKGSDETS